MGSGCTSAIAAHSLVGAELALTGVGVALSEVLVTRFPREPQGTPTPGCAPTRCYSSTSWKFLEFMPPITSRLGSEIFHDSPTVASSCSCLCGSGTWEDTLASSCRCEVRARGPVTQPRASEG